MLSFLTHTQSKVYRATEVATGRAVALKQSRASLRVKRPLLQHESNVLNILSGHPSIPTVYAYGRIDHFELMSMELLDQSLGDFVQQKGPLSVIQVAEIGCQIVNALEHMSIRGLAHRDIKPDNIMLYSRASSRVCLIDFGLTYRVPDRVHPTNISNSPEKPQGVFGTLPYASLNAHRDDQILSYRDDLESLSYTLLWLLCGSLPWSPFACHGTRLGRIRQVYEQKKRHSGSTISAYAGAPSSFGDLVDYSRALNVHQKPDYGSLVALLAGVQKNYSGLSKGLNGNGTQHFSRSSASVSERTAPSAAFPLVELGQVVLVKIIPDVTAEGYSPRAGHENSYVPDPRFELPEWFTRPRPAVITRVEYNEKQADCCFEAVAVSRFPRGTDHDLPDLSTALLPEGAKWPFEDTFCYAFMRPLRFHCLPQQEPVISSWRISPGKVKSLANLFEPLSRKTSNQDAKYSDIRDVRHDARMRSGYVKVFAQILPLTLDNILDNSTEWFSTRAWFDECVKASRINDLYNHRWWTGAWFPRYYVPKEGDLSGSYMESDFEEWEPAQGERDPSITLSSNSPRSGSHLVGEVVKLDRIVALEEE
ncbi:casein kinase [Ceratobasidium sp. AG-Ba]|nr:casein kinase [Ceratobasidium sp. AG-Ba]QRW11587.1 casein kinase [Ceratobasidium sp. AG-Ba]